METRLAFNSPLLRGRATWQAELLAPFLHPLMLHVCSALTHLQDAVRADALATLELVLDHAPRGALARYTHQVRAKRSNEYKSSAGTVHAPGESET